MAKKNYETENNQPVLKHITWYIRDASGNVLSIYEQDTTNVLIQKDIPVYGSGKLGMTDHLGNVRALVREERINVLATLETGQESKERSSFLRYDDVRKVNAAIFDHTGGAISNYAIRLNGSANEKIGLAKSLEVHRGDTVNMEVYAKYVDPNTGNVTAALN